MHIKSETVGKAKAKLIEADDFHNSIFDVIDQGDTQCRSYWPMIGNLSGKWNSPDIVNYIEQYQKLVTAVSDRLAIKAAASRISVKYTRHSYLYLAIYSPAGMVSQFFQLLGR